METAKPAFTKYLLVCENKRDKGACCAPAGIHLRELLKKGIQERGFAKKIRVSRSGCLDVCSEGPNVLLMPDNIWFKRVGEKEVEEIIQLACLGI